jgi:hypothetical protein
VLDVRWLLLFGGIALFAILWFAYLGWWLWHKVTALAVTVAEAKRALASASSARQDVGSNGHAARHDCDGRGPYRRPAGAGQRG